MFKKFISFFWSSDSETNAPGAGTDDPPHANASDSNGDGFSGFAGKAAAQVVAPITNEFNYVLIQRMPANGAILGSAAVALENADGSMTVARCMTRVQTGSGEIVHPLEITARCSHPDCGQVEAATLRCFIGGEVCCYLHCRQIVVEGKEQIVCLKHLEILLRDWDAWAEYDRARGIVRLPSGTPPQPVAVKIEPPKLVFIKESNHGPQQNIK